MQQSGLLLVKHGQPRGFDVKKVSKVICPKPLLNEVCPVVSQPIDTLADFAERLVHPETMQVVADPDGAPFPGA